ncbi:M23 family metallopeptidase [Erysipelothrix sp. HDW6A]|uniref:M23 family metallopeptidase n=1 Tax=Erysipelothrix sp. HDW6A TaxID=2714928 RepID=UPI00140910CD|nr:M23 family metallopeptidase [Erysipelothrix sp. HDW6A]QIK57757.1 M23 family metallopeptidase [Erysipelothrix sp. HDW6A]
MIKKGLQKLTVFFVAFLLVFSAMMVNQKSEVYAASDSTIIEGRFQFVVDSNKIIKFAREFNDKGELVRVYEYFPNTKYGQDHGKKIKFEFEIYPNAAIKFSRERNTKQELIAVYEYHEPSYYGDGHGSRIKFKFNTYSNGFIKNAIAYNLKGEITQAYEYHDAWYGDGHGSKIKFRFELYPNAAIKHAVGYDKNQNAVRLYEYLEPSYYGDGHGSRIKSITDLTPSGNKYVYPVANRHAPITCGIGCYSGHTGIDLGVSRGTKVFNIAEGIVRRIQASCPTEGYRGSGCGNRFGNHVVVEVMKDGKRYFVYYGHLSQNSIKVSVGQKVSTNTLLGLSGNSGDSDGPHLHVEVRLNDVKATSVGSTIDFRRLFGL